MFIHRQLGIAKIVKVPRKNVFHSLNKSFVMLSIRNSLLSLLLLLPPLLLPVGRLLQRDRRRLDVENDLADVGVGVVGEALVEDRLLRQRRGSGDEDRDDDDETENQLETERYVVVSRKVIYKWPTASLKRKQ